MHFDFLSICLLPPKSLFLDIIFVCFLRGLIMSKKSVVIKTDRTMLIPLPKNVLIKMNKSM